MSTQPDSVSSAEIERYFEWCDTEGIPHEVVPDSPEDDD